VSLRSFIVAVAFLALFMAGFLAYFLAAAAH